MAYGTKGKIQPRKKPKKARKVPKAGLVSTGQRGGRAIGAGLSKRVGAGTAGKAGRTIGGLKKPSGGYPGKTTWDPDAKKPKKRKPPARRRGR